jgi:thioredoxin 1
MKKIIAIIFLMGLFGCVEEKRLDYNTNVKNFQPIVVEAFNEADKIMEEKEEEISDGQHPDADKCICKGTGRIVHGDGHSTDCKYHKATKQDNLEENKFKELEQELNNKNVIISDLELQLENLNKQIVELKDIISKLNDIEKMSAKKEEIKILYFTAAWCGPCRQQKAELDKMKTLGYDIGTEESSQIRILDVEKDLNLYNKYRGATASIPLQVIIKNGEVHSRIVGFTYKEKIIEQLSGNN